jgi:hypothetical protein
MAKFLQFKGREITTGAGRLALHTGVPNVLATDPADLSDLFVAATMAWATGWTDVGSTDGGITLTKGFAETDYKVDQSGGSVVKSEITENTATVETVMAETGDIEKFAYNMFGAAATTVNVTTSSRKKGLAAYRVAPHKSAALAEIDEADKLRIFYLRDTAPNAGDTAYTLNTGAMHTLALRLRAFPDFTHAGSEFGFFVEDDGFGGIDSP